ncbi:unnamed protein product [Paramecium primaurelia]|uniref:Guanylate cyclase domain-containing protein n=1 Tax=Paramecium primaurelia TaxID=5886 RepID=A0A8S1JSA9_PARPR|nr:unnamed protein product [Paramecium primaurelia]
MLYRIIEKIYKQIPLKYQQRLKDLELENLQNMRIEITNGIVQKTFNYEVLTNKIHLIQVFLNFNQTSTVIKETIRILFKLETLPIYPLIYLIILPDMLKSEFYIIIYTILCLILDLLISFLLLFYVLKERWKFEETINKQECRILSPIDQLLQTQNQSPSQKIEWQKLKIGQIVCLLKGEMSPANILILESSQQQVLADYIIKYPCPCTFVNQASKTKGIMTKFLINLSGWIQFSTSHKGTIKLKNDPKATQFSDENVIYRGQILNQTDWIFGIAIQVGHGCFQQRDRFYNWNHYNQNSFFIFLMTLLIFIILIIPKLIYVSNSEISTYSNAIIICLLLFPQNYFLINQVWLLIQSIQTRSFQTKQSKILTTNIQQQGQNKSDPILQEYEKKVLVQLQKIASVNTSLVSLPQIKKNPNQDLIYLFHQLSNQTILEFIKTDVVVFENPQKLLKKNIRVCMLFHDKCKYYFNYEKLQAIIEKTTPRQKINYEKLLLDTNRFSAYDEQKTQDIDLLLAEKQQPTLRVIEEKKSFQKIGFLKDQSKINQIQKEMKDSKDLKKSGGEQKMNPYSSFRKQSARNLFQSNMLAQQQQKEQHYQQPTVNNGSFITYQNSPKIQRQKSNSHLSQTNVLNNQKSVTGSLKNITPTQQDQSSDQIVGDIYSEQDFINKLLNKSDVVSNEILIMLLLCNNVESVYDKEEKKIENIYKNTFDKSILDFVKIFDYKFISSAIIDNYKIEYKQDQITKKAISIQGVIKVFDIIATLHPTENRSDTLTILVKDPESFELEEGVLLYTRIVANDSNSKDERLPFINDIIDDMFWDGQKSIKYYKKQLDSLQTEQFLTKLNTINETYGNREQELDLLYQQIESESELLFVIGLKQFIPLKNQLVSQEITNNYLSPDKLFQTLQKYNFKSCFLMDTYEDLIQFLRTYHITERKSIEHFIEPNTIQFKFRQFIQNIIEKQNIFEVYQQKIVDNFLIINDQTLEAIVKDDYLKYHFVVLFYFSQGIGAYGLDEKQKGKFLKLLQITERYITSIGPGLDNQYFFYKSNYSFNVVQQDPQCTLSNPNFLIQKVDQLFKLLFYYCPTSYLNYESIILIQIYRSFLFGFTSYIIDYQNNFNTLDELILFYLFPSNIVTCLLNYETFFIQRKFDNNNFEIYRKTLELIKQQNIYIKIIKIIFVALLDSILVEICFNIFDITQTQELQHYSLFIYLIIELVEKQKYLISFFNSFYENVKMLKLIFSFIILIFLLILVYALITNDILYQFSYLNFTYWIFGLIFSVVISFVFQEVLILTDFNLSSPQDINFHSEYQVEIEKINSVLKYLNVNMNHKNQPKKFIEKLFQGKDFMDELLVKKIKGDQQMTDQMEKDLKFTDKRTEKDFQNSLKPQKYYIYLIYEIAIFGIRVYQQINNLNISYLVISIIQFVSMTFIPLIKVSKYQPIFLLCLRFIFFVILHSLMDTKLIETQMFIIGFSISHHPLLGIYGYYCVCIISILLDIVMVGIFNNGNPFYILNHGLIIIEMFIPLVFQIYKTEFLQRYQYILQNKLLDEYKKLNDALGLLMPRFIKERMSKGQIQISEDQGDVAILFCDIYDFDDIIKNEQIRVVDFLDNLYRQFDQFCQANELQKIETVGKTYMAAGGLKDYNISDNLNPTERILDTAMQMLESVKTMKYGDNKAVILKIGIHYGRVIAGVIGAHKPQFSLIGDTVNTTSRVCSTSEPGIITLSQQAYEKVNNQKNQFKLREVEAKGKGTINTYQLIKTSKKKQQTTIKMADDVAKSPNCHTPNQIFKKIQENLYTKKKTILKKVSFSEERQDFGNPLTIQNTIANGKLTTNLAPLAVQPLIRASSRSIFNSSYQMGINLNNEQEQEINNINAINNNNIINNTINNTLKDDRDKNKVEQTNINNIQGDGLKSSIPLGGYGTQGTYSKRVSNLAMELNPMKSRRSIYKRAGTKTNIGEDPILNMPIGGGQKMAESVRVELQNIKRKKTRVIGENKLDFIEKHDSQSANKSPKEQRNIQNMDELEIRKLINIEQSCYQNQYDIKKMEEKVEIEKYGIQESDYQSENHHLYFTIYEQYRDYNRKQIQMFIIFLVIMLIIKNLLYYLLKNINIELQILFICQSVICLLLAIAIYNITKNIILKWLIGLYFLIFSIIDILIINVHISDMELIFQVSQITSVYLNLFYLQIYNQQDRIKLSILYILLILINLIYNEYILEIIFFSISVFLQSIMIQHKELKILVENYQCYSQFESKNAKQTQILQYLLPQHIIGRFFSTDANTSDNFIDVFENCTILFADIAGFTKYSGSVEPEQVVNMLRILFQQFDEECQRFQVYKLYTIGDCYVCMGIIDANNRDPVGEAINVVLFGLKMIQIIQQINKDPQYQHLNMRIGAHTGRVIGGVVGTDVVRYDIYGEDVTTANKMESKGQEGKIMVSQATKDLIESDDECVGIFDFEFAQDVFLPQKNTTISSYFVHFDQNSDEQ